MNAEEGAERRGGPGGPPPDESPAEAQPARFGGLDFFARHGSQVLSKAQELQSAVAQRQSQIREQAERVAERAQEVHQAVVQSGVRVREGAEKAVATAKEVHETVAQKASLVREGAAQAVTSIQETHQAVSQSVLEQSNQIQEAARKTAASAQELQQSVVESGMRVHEGAVQAVTAVKETHQRVSQSIADTSNQVQEGVKQAAASAQEFHQAVVQSGERVREGAVQAATAVQETHQKVQEGAVQAVTAVKETHQRVSQSIADTGNQVQEGVKQAAASAQELHQAVVQSGEKVREGAAQAAMTAQETQQKVRQSLVEQGARVQEGTKQAVAVTQDVSHSVSQAAILGGEHLQEKAKQAVAGAQEAHQAVTEAANTEGMQKALGVSLGYGAKAAVASYAAYEGVRSAAMEKTAEAGAMAAQAINERLDPETQQKIRERTSQALEYAHVGAQHIANRGEEFLTLGYTQYTEASKAITEVVEEAYSSLPEEHRRKIEESRRRVDEAKEHAKAIALDVSKPVRRKVIATVGDVLKRAATGDPDMWSWVRRLVAVVLDDFWADVEVEVEQALEVNLMRELRTNVEEAPAKWGCRSLLLACVLRPRAFVLYHFLPCDKSIFGMLKDPVYVVFLALTLFPFYSVRIIFFTLLLVLLASAPDGVDEYQLISFILSSKGMQFFTGVLLNAFGSGQYYYAIHFCHLSQECIDQHTPGQGEPPIFAIVDFFGSVLLVWAAFGLLPRSKKHGLLTALRSQTNTSGWSPKAASDDPDSAAVKKQGGRLFRVLWWDLVWFTTCCVALVVLQVLTGCSLGSPEFLANLFWCRVAYAMLSVPFFLFTLPGVRQLLTHAEPTGFSPKGMCVPLILGHEQQQQPTRQQSRYEGRSSAQEPLLSPSAG